MNFASNLGKKVPWSSMITKGKEKFSSDNGNATSRRIFALAMQLSFFSTKSNIKPEGTRNKSGDDSGKNLSPKSPESAATSIAKIFRFEGSGVALPHKDKVYKGGEDAHFISEAVLAVADGVGGWAEYGIDPALYARKLMEGARLAVEQKVGTDPVKIMQFAYNHAKDVTGSSTACVVVLEGGTLKAANLGDSGFMIIRKSNLLLKSEEQQHGFNFPFQLGSESRDKPEHSQIYKQAIEEGDVVILGTDGLFDNLFKEEILKIQQKHATSDPKTLAQAVAESARTASVSKTKQSPFAVGAGKAGLRFQGGKEDDITVVVGVVKKY